MQRLDGNRYKVRRWPLGVVSIPWPRINHSNALDLTDGSVEDQTTKNPLNVSIQRAHALVPRDGLEPSRRVTPADFE